MTTPNHQAELLPCPNPWCEAPERDGDFSPDVVRGLFDTLFVACTSCCMKGPVRATRAEAIAAWNTRPASHEAELVEALITLRDYVCDAAQGALTYEGSGDGFIAMAKDDLARIEAALAKAMAGAS